MTRHANDNADGAWGPSIAEGCPYSDRTRRNGTRPSPELRWTRACETRSIDPLSAADMGRSALWTDVLISVGLADAGGVCWARATMPSLLEVGLLGAAFWWEGVADPLRRGLLRYFSAVTQLEPAQWSLEAPGPASAAMSAALFQPRQRHSRSMSRLGQETPTR